MHWVIYGIAPSIEGLPEARTIGVDGLTPLMETMLTATFPNAELVDGHALMLETRKRKLPEEESRSGMLF